MTTTACAMCLAARAAQNHQGRCFPDLHSPGGEKPGTMPFRPGKTARDRRSNASAERKV